MQLHEMWRSPKKTINVKKKFEFYTMFDKILKNVQTAILFHDFGANFFKLNPRF